jgi:hypothetical protein
MKKLMVIAMSLTVVLAASAQRGHTVVVAGGRYPVGVYAYPHVAFGVGFYPSLYSPFGFYGYPLWGFAYGGYLPYGPAYYSPSKLQRKEEDIKSDYADRIYSVRQDNSLTNKEKRQEVRRLKKQRDQEIHDLITNYHKQP